MLKDNKAKHARLGGKAAWQGYFFGGLLAIGAACGALGAAPKEVLLLHSFGQGFEPFKSFTEMFRSQLTEQLGEPVEFHDVTLESARFESGATEGPLVDYLSLLFAARRLDLVVTIGGPAARFGEKYRPRLFPSTPMLFAAVDQRHLQTVALTTNDVAAAVANDPSRTLENILHVLPETTNVAVVIGNSPLEQFWLGEMRRLFQPFASRANFVWFNDLSFAEMQRRIAALPPRSAIFYVLFAIDVDGVPQEEKGVLAKLHAVANAPIFGLHDTQLGRGVVGGPLMAFEQMSLDTAKAAVRVLHGEAAGSIKIPVQASGKPMYDWRELRRWHISETRLPAGSIVRYRQPSFWELYRGRVIAVMVLCLGEGALIVLLWTNMIKRRRAERSVRESEERLSLAAMAADLGVWAWDVRRDEVWVTANWRRLFGFPPETVIRYATVLERIHPEDRAAMDRTIQHALKDRADFVIEHRVVLPDNTQRWLAARGRLDPTVGAKRVRMLGASVDITARKRVEESLLQRNHYIETILEQAPIGFAIHTIDDGVGRFVSARYEEFYGVPKGTIDSHASFFDRVWPNHPELREEIRRRVVADMTSGDARRMCWENVPVPPRSGETRYITAMNIPVLDQNLMISTVQDVTARVRALEALRESESINRATFEQAAVGIAHVGIDGHWLRVNDKLCAIVGYERAELVKMTAQDITHPDDLKKDLDSTRQLLSGEIKTYSTERRYLRKDRLVAWAHLAVSLVRDAAGDPLHFITAVQDITEHKQAELEIKLQREDLAHAARVSVMGELATSVAHELNQPLGAILSNAEAAEMFLAQDPPALGEVRAILVDIRKDDERAGEVIRRMRSLLRKHELEREPLEINSLVEDVFRLVSSDASLRQIALNAELSPNLPAVKGDRIHLQQVLLNLVVNGMEAMTNPPSEKRRLTVRTNRVSDGVVEVSVTDSGPGIERDNLPRIFEPFFTTKASGIGMGLSISRKIVEAHHGRISAENHPAGGSIFRVTLPGALGEEKS